MGSRHVVAAAVAVAVAAALSGCGPDYAECSVLCGGDGLLCPAGMVCGSDQFCYANEGQAGEGACSRAPLPGDGGGSPDGFEPSLDASSQLDARADLCGDDLEPNDIRAQASPTGVPGSGSQFAHSGAVCPGEDIDLFAFGLGTTARVRTDAFLSVDADATQFRLVYLNTDGGEISSATGLIPQLPIVHEDVLPPGNYFLGVMGRTINLTTGYALELSLLAP